MIFAVIFIIHAYKPAGGFSCIGIQYPSKPGTVAKGVDLAGLHFIGTTEWFNTLTRIRVDIRARNFYYAGSRNESDQCISILQGASMKLCHGIPAAVVLLAVLCLAGCGGGNSPEMELGGINTGDYLDGLLSRTFRALGSINSMESAEAAVPVLKAINDDYDDLIYHIPKLSEKGRADMSKKAQKALPEIQDMARRINDTPGLSGVLGPSMDAMVEKIGLLL